jgi:hypothetical protein
MHKEAAMALDSTMVRVAVTGGVFVSLDGSGTVPTDATTSIPGSFDELGYLSEDGVTQTINADTSNIQAWQNADIVRKVQTSHDVTYKFTALELNPTSLEAYFGNYNAGVVEITSDPLPTVPWVVDVFDGDELIRLAIPAGQVTERGDVQFVNNQAVTLPLTITAYPVDGVKAYLYRATLEGS